MEKLLTKEVVSTLFVIGAAICVYFIIKQLLLKWGLKKARQHRNKKAMTVLTLVTNIIKYLFIVVVALMILEIWGFDTKALVASLGVVGVVAGLAMQDLLKDFIGGATILADNQFKVGDNIQIGSFRGTVISLGMQTTKIRAYTGEVKIIANRNINEVINYSAMPSVCVVDVELSYEDNVETAEKVLKEVVEKVSKQVNYLKRPILILGIEKISKNTVVYRIEAEVTSLKDFEFNRIFLKEIKKEAEANNLTLSYNRVDVHNA